MSDAREPAAHLDVDSVAPEVALALQAAAAGHEVTLLSGGHPVGTLHVRMAGQAAPNTHAAAPYSPDSRVREGVTVVATAMKLSDAARRRLSDELGDDYIVVDFAKAPSTADVLLTPAISPQLLVYLRQQFPNARVVITEIEDDELGISYSGPVSRLLDAGASAYLPPRALPQVAAALHAHLSRDSQPALEARGQERPASSPPELEPFT